MKLFLNNVGVLYLLLVLTDVLNAAAVSKGAVGGAGGRSVKGTNLRISFQYDFFCKLDHMKISVIFHNLF